MSVGDAIVKQKFVDAHWVVLSRGLSFVLSKRPTAYEVFYALQNGISAPALPPVSPQIGPVLEDYFFT